MGLLRRHLETMTVAGMRRSARAARQPRSTAWTSNPLAGSEEVSAAQVASHRFVPPMAMPPPPRLPIDRCPQLAIPRKRAKGPGGRVDGAFGGRRRVPVPGGLVLFSILRHRAIGYRLSSYVLTGFCRKKDSLVQHKHAAAARRGVAMPGELPQRQRGCLNHTSSMMMTRMGATVVASARRWAIAIAILCIVIAVVRRRRRGLVSL